MSYKTNKSYKSNSLTEFIRSWDFANPSWENLPLGFPDCDTSTLTQKQDKHLFDAIKTEWVISGGGRRFFYKSIAKRALVGTTIVALLLFAKNLVSTSESLTRNVSAKTVGEKVGEIVQATMSAVFR